MQERNAGYKFDYNDNVAVSFLTNRKQFSEASSPWEACDQHQFYLVISPEKRKSRFPGV